MKSLWALDSVRGGRLSLVWEESDMPSEAGAVVGAGGVAAVGEVAAGIWGIGRTWGLLWMGFVDDGGSRAVAHSVLLARREGAESGVANSAHFLEGKQRWLVATASANGEGEDSGAARGEV